MNLSPPKFATQNVTDDVRKKLTLSLSESRDIKFKEIRCAYCNSPIAFVSVSATGHIWIKCQKCKAEFPINTAYFYKSRTYRRPEPFLINLKNE